MNPLIHEILDTFRASPGLFAILLERRKQIEADGPNVPPIDGIAVQFDAATPVLDLQRAGAAIAAEIDRRLRVGEAHVRISKGLIP